MIKRVLLISIMVLAAVLMTACGSGTKKVEIDVDMKEFGFDPAEVTVPAGAEVTLNLTNSGTLDHEWVIISLGEKATAPFDDDDEDRIFWEKELAPGETESVTFTAPSDPGEYELVCGTPGHMEAGMVGTLTVAQP